MYSNRFLRFIRDTIKDEIKVIRLPIKSRNPRVIIENLESVNYEYKGNMYNLWVVCRGLECKLCIVKGDYDVAINRVRVVDELSGLRHGVPKLAGIVDGKVVWGTRWSGEVMVVDDIMCDAILDYKMELICDGVRIKVECRDIECILKLVEELC